MAYIKAIKFFMRNLTISYNFNVLKGESLHIPPRHAALLLFECFREILNYPTEKKCFRYARRKWKLRSRLPPRRPSQRLYTSLIPNQHQSHNHKANNWTQKQIFHLNSIETHLSAFLDSKATNFSSQNWSSSHAYYAIDGMPSIMKSIEHNASV